MLAKTLEQKNYTFMLAKILAEEGGKSTATKTYHESIQVLESLLQALIRALPHLLLLPQNPRHPCHPHPTARYISTATRLQIRRSRFLHLALPRSRPHHIANPPEERIRIVLPPQNKRNHHSRRPQPSLQTPSVDLDPNPRAREHVLDRFLWRENVDDGGERDGDAVAVGFVDPDDAMRGEDEEAGSEGREGWVFFGFEIDGGDEGAFNFAGEEDGAAAASEVDGRQPFPGHVIG